MTATEVRTVASRTGKRAGIFNWRMTMDNEWLIFADGCGIVSLRGMALYHDPKDGWQFLAPWTEPGDFYISEAEALRFLAKAGCRWNGKTIVRMEAALAATADAPALAPVDLSKPAEGGQYAVVFRNGHRRPDYPTEFGEKWPTYIVAAWRVVFP